MEIIRPIASNPIVALRDVSYEIGGRLILDRLSLEVAAGETLVLLGRSGSGKTTLLKLVNGLLFPTRGVVEVEGMPTTRWDPIRLKRRIGYVIQEVGLFPHFTIAQNVGLVPRLDGMEPAAIAARVQHLLGEVGLDPQEFSSRYPRELSGGQRQRAGVARALAADPPLLLFDEPFGAADPITRLELQDQFLALRRTLGKSAMFVTHDVREALRLGTRIALLNHGRLETIAEPREFVRASSPEASAFLACLQEQEQEKEKEKHA
jgi:osmoprotectant transport system ATP-binding protein